MVSSEGGVSNQVSPGGSGSLEWSLYMKVCSMVKSGDSWSLCSSMWVETSFRVEKKRPQMGQRYMSAPAWVFRWPLMVERPRK